MTENEDFWTTISCECHLRINPTGRLGQAPNRYGHYDSAEILDVKLSRMEAVRGI